MEAERNRRKQLLDTQAQVNVAEGNKQRVILESEGHLVAKSNEADAKYKTVFREAEARCVPPIPMRLNAECAAENNSP